MSDLDRPLRKHKVSLPNAALDHALELYVVAERLFHDNEQLVDLSVLLVVHEVIRLNRVDHTAMHVVVDEKCGPKRVVLVCGLLVVL